MISTSQRTIYGLKLLNNMLVGKHYKTLTNTTLNEKFDIFPDTKTPMGQYPRLKYFTIGIGGRIKLKDTNIYTISEHLPVDAALYEHIPFIIRLADDDLSDEERKRYRLRKNIFINGVSYYAYYAKVCDSIDSRDYYNAITSKDDTAILSMFNIKDSSLLNPEPADRLLDLDTINKASYVFYRFIMPFVLKQDEVQELINVYKVLGLPDTTILTEIGICFGHEIEAPYGNEIIDTQIGFHAGTELNIRLIYDKNEDYAFNIEIGGAEPLLLGT